MTTSTDEHTAHHRSAEQLAAATGAIEAAPRERGVLRGIVRRPAEGEREVLEVGTLSLAEGLVGDSWQHRGSRRSDDGGPHPDMQLNVMSTRVLAAIADEDRWPLAGDQLLVDLDLSQANLPAGTRLRIGAAVVEVTAEPHRGCAKFSARFGRDALRFVNVGAGVEGRYRGLCARVVEPGEVRVGDAVAKA